MRSREKITSDYSNEVSFAAQDEDNLTPLTAVVHHHGKLNEIRVFLSARVNSNPFPRSSRTKRLNNIAAKKLIFKYESRKLTKMVIIKMKQNGQDAQFYPAQHLKTVE